MTDEFSEKPWTEQQWEDFLRQTEVRSARYGELFETLAEHPERDELIDREMGWDHEPEEPEFELPWEQAEYDDDEFDEEEVDEVEVEAIKEELQQRRSNLRELPAFSVARQWALAAHRLFENAGELDTELEEIVSRAQEGCLSVGAKIAAGHGMGEEEQTLCGNIVCCKRAAAFAEQGIEALNELVQRGSFSAAAIQPLIEQGQQVRSLIEERIRELARASGGNDGEASGEMPRLFRSWQSMQPAAMGALPSYVPVVAADAALSTPAEKRTVGHRGSPVRRIGNSPFGRRGASARSRGSLPLLRPERCSDQ